MAFRFTDSEKFSLIAVDDCFSDIEEEVELEDGTWVLPKMPTDVGDTWAKWIGTSRLERLTDANLILVRRITSEKPEILDGDHMELYQQVFDIWNMLQLSGIVCYADASALQGSFESGQANIRQMVHLDQFYLTNGSPQYPITRDRMKEATEIAAVWRDMAGSKKFDRFLRGGVILRQGMTEHYGQERIHQFTRAIEALIKPAKSGTTKQFKNRPQTFGVSGSKMEKILYESYEMRCDVEHVHSPDKFLKNDYGEDEIETIAALRTRQMEVLAREAYRKILTNPDIRKHFETDDALDAFWALSNDERRKLWGVGVDVTGFTSEDESNEKIRQLREKYGY